MPRTDQRSEVCVCVCAHARACICGCESLVRPLSPPSSISAQDARSQAAGQVCMCSVWHAGRWTPLGQFQCRKDDNAPAQLWGPHVLSRSLGKAKVTGPAGCLPAQWLPCVSSPNFPAAEDTPFSLYSPFFSGHFSIFFSNSSLFSHIFSVSNLFSELKLLSFLAIYHLHG